MGQAKFKQSNGMIGVNIIAACGVLTPEQMANLSSAAQECEVFRFKLTSRQTIVAVLNEEKADILEKKVTEMGLKVSPFEKAIRGVKACAGNSALCPRSLSDALDLGIEIQDKYIGKDVPKDLKISVAGCQRGCTDPLCAGVGFIARGADIFDVYIGGRGGSSKPVHGNLLVEKVNREDVFKLIDYILKQYKTLAEPKEHIATTLERLGLFSFLPPQGIITQGEESSEEFLTFLDGKE